MHQKLLLMLSNLQFRRLQALILQLLLLFVAALPVQARDNSGYQQQNVFANGIEIKVHIYQPENCDKPSLLFVFHGLKRNAKSYLEKAVKIANKACLKVFAPLFDKPRFPNWRYHRAGVVYKGMVQPNIQWTAPVLEALLEYGRNSVKHAPRLYLFGHSAGAQFLSRIAAYSSLQDIDRIVIANPSVHVVPDLDEPAPYGFGGVFTNDSLAQTQIRNYLATAITIYLGQQDTGDKYLVQNKAANRQGKNRLQRGRNIFHRARAMALKNGWSFNWTLVEVPDVGHSSRKMLAAAEMSSALGLDKKISQQAP